MSSCSSNGESEISSTLPFQLPSNPPILLYTQDILNPTPDSTLDPNHSPATPEAEKSKKATPNGTGGEGLEEETDESKLNIKFVDQT